METWKMDDFLQKLKKVVCIVLYGLAISQSDFRKASPYQLLYKTIVTRCRECINVGGADEWTTLLTNKFGTLDLDVLI